MNFRKVISGLLVVGSLFLSSFWCSICHFSSGRNVCFASEYSENAVGGKDKYKKWINDSKMVKVVFFTMAGVTLATVAVDLVSRVLHAVEVFKDIKGGNKPS